MQITTLPVYSKLAEPAAIPSEVAERLPKGWQLSQHQLETYEALTDPNIDVVINTAMMSEWRSR
jgi:CRISPR-associated endonuclease/helicase Cas3